MEKKNDLQIFRLRTTGAAIADGYRLYLGNFRRLFRSSWIMAAVYAVAACVFTKVSISLAPEMAILSYLNIDPSAALSALGMLPVWLALSSLLFLLASVGMASYGFLVMSEHQSSGTVSIPEKWYGRISWKMAGRTLAATLSIMLLYAVAQAAVIAAAWAARHALSATAAAILLGLLQLMLLAAFVPAAYCGMKYVLTPKASLFPTLASAYPAGLRHWGALFVVMLIAGIVTTLMGYATELPAVILGLANMSSQMGTLQGDPAGMPEYMGWMTVVVLCIAGFIQAYVQLTAMFPLYYIYGSIETVEKEARERKALSEFERD